VTAWSNLPDVEAWKPEFSDRLFRAIFIIGNQKQQYKTNFLIQLTRKKKMRNRNLKVGIALTALLVFGMNAFAQSDDAVVWKKNFGGNGSDQYNSVTVVSDGIVAAGSSRNDSFGIGDWEGFAKKGDNNSHYKAIIVKYDNNGDVVWKKNFGGNSNDNEEYQSATTVSDGIIVVGYSGSGSFGTGDWEGVTGKGSRDAIIVKYDNNGGVVWKNNFGGIGSNIYSSVTTVSDGIIAVGSSASSNTGDWAGVTGGGGSNNAIIVKYNNNGGVVWKKKFGGMSSDSYSSVTTVSDGIIAVGYSFGMSFGNGDWVGFTGKGNPDAIIVKYDNNGNVVWKNNFGGINEDYYNSVTVGSNGSIIAVGYSAVGLYGNDSFGNGDWQGFTGKGGTDAIIVKWVEVE